MLKRLSKWVLGLGVAVLAAQSAQADLASWHVTPGGQNQTQFDQNFTALWVPYGVPGSTPNPNNASAPANGQINGIDYSIWDNYGPHGNAATGSFHNVQDFGGQQFDAKAMFVRNDANNLYVAIVTGFNPAGVTDSDGVSYKLGDLAINPDHAHATSQFGVISLAGPAGSSGTTSLVAGGTWYVPNAAQGWDDVKTNYLSGGNTLATDVHYAYSDLGLSYRDDTTGKYVTTYLLEYSIPLADLGASNGESFTFSWGPSCSNDILTTTHTVTAVPEPASISVLGGAAILLLSRRRAKRTA